MYSFIELIDYFVCYLGEIYIDFVNQALTIQVAEKFKDNKICHVVHPVTVLAYSGLVTSP